MWQRKIHEKGGIQVNGKRYGVEFVLVNIGDQTLSEIERKVPVVTRLLAQGNYGPIDAILAPYSSSLTPLAAAAAPNLPVLAAGAASDSVYQCNNLTQCYDKDKNIRFGNLFGVLASASHYFDIILNMARVRKLGKVALLWDPTPFGIEACTGAEERALELNLPIVYANSIDDMNMQELKESDPDFLIGCTYPDTCVKLLKTLQSQDWVPKAVALSTCLRHPDVEGNTSHRFIMGPTQWHTSHFEINYQEPVDLPEPYKSISLFPMGPNISSAARFRNEYFNENGREPPYQAASAMAALYALHFAILSGNSTSPSSVIKQLRNINGVNSLKSFWGYIGFDKYGRMAEYDDFSTLQFDENSKLQVITPIRMASADLIYPMPSYKQYDCLTTHNCSSNGVCMRGGDCLCFVPHHGTTCEQNEYVRALLESDRCKGLWIACLVILILILTALTILGLTGRSRSFWKQMASDMETALNKNRDDIGTHHVNEISDVLRQ
eukprot:NODE_2314_length_1618_cov_25.735117_g1985_i0.p1 GENE.NODE_2314_length_1618_cov_25.735117_g1985_i0~~NODE_2314_length_1618_cov_25.735117_g1985_i0.p1  ORF type:complete len:512 (+),score=71.31 NODE_2314_length_1618_cov_25.735117_g1985_i0:57-1538(+)